jgi:NADH-ubiquinone oxidoreductase chain 1
VATFMLSLVAWAVVPFDYGMVLSDSNMGYFICLPYLR